MAPSSVRPLSAPTSLAIREALLRLLSGQDLTRLQMTQAMEALLAGEATPAQVGALAAILRLKRETDEELAAALETCRTRLPKIPHTRSPLLACATSGSESLHAKNVFSGVALVASAAGLACVETVQQGGAGRCGSAELLAAVGVPLDRDVAALGLELEAVGVTFARASVLLPGLRHLVGGRAELGFASVFQLLAALVNPAGARHHLLGCQDAGALEQVARLLGRLGAARVWAMRGLDGTDALSPSAPSEVASLEDDGHVRLFTITPADAGLEPAPAGALEGGSPDEQARSLRALLSGEESALRTAVLLNSAAALYLTGRAASLRQGADLAARAIDSGAAMGKLAALTGQ